jgi:hypothetical protein
MALSWLNSFGRKYKNVGSHSIHFKGNLHAEKLFQDRLAQPA